MDPRTIPNLHDYLLKAASGPADSGEHDLEERACARNFLLDERPPEEALKLYKGYFASGPVSDLDDWLVCHRGFAKEQLFIDPDESLLPLTFLPWRSTGKRRAKCDDPHFVGVRAGACAETKG